MKYVGIIEDRLTTPFIKVQYYGHWNVIEFPFVYDNDYQKKRWYSDEKILNATDFHEMTHNQYNY